MTGPATTYLRITQAVEALVREHEENDPDTALRLIVRAAMLQMSPRQRDQTVSALRAEFGGQE